MTIVAMDHVALTVKDLEATCAFYDRLFGVVTHAELVVEGRALARQIRMGGAMLSIHQQGNGIDLVAQAPVPGAGDFCFQWGGTIQSAIDLLSAHGIAVIAGPAPRVNVNGVPSQSVYFRDPDANLVELMAPD
ncbi:MAG: glyoxalase [Sphingomonadales bacterium]|nr:MAG: glyoxalase [Sphingomonadales bacterium]